MRSSLGERIYLYFDYLLFVFFLLDFSGKKIIAK